MDDDTIVMGSVTYAGRREVRERWLRAFLRLQAPPGTHLIRVIVDNTPGEPPWADWGPLLARYDRKRECTVVHDDLSDLTPGERLAHGYTLLRAFALDNGALGMLSVEADVLPPPDALQRLSRGARSDGLAVICAPVPDKGGRALVMRAMDAPCCPLDLPAFLSGQGAMIPFALPGVLAARNRLLDTTWYAWREVRERRRPFRVAGVHLGCTWIPRAVLAVIPFRMDRVHPAYKPDIWFSWDATRAGFPLWADPRVRAQHLYREGHEWGVDAR